MQTDDPGEFASMFLPLHESPSVETRLRRAARASAHDYAWPHVLERCLLPRVGLPTEAIRQAS